MPPKRTCDGSTDDRAKKMKEVSGTEISEQRDACLESDRMSISQSRANKASLGREALLGSMYKRVASGTPGRPDEQLEVQQIKVSDELRTSDQQGTRREKNRYRMTMQRATETQEQRMSRLDAVRRRAAMRRAEETQKQRLERREANRRRMEIRRAEETIEEREVRLQSERQRRIRAVQAHRWMDLKRAAFSYDPRVEFFTHPKVVIGKMDVICVHCQARKFAGEAQGMCCSNGKVKLPLLRDPPEPLCSYLNGITQESRHFMQNIRKYNSCFQMTSFGTTAVIEESGFMPTFKIQGQVYHRAGSLLPAGDQGPKFLQLYFVSNEQMQANQRCANVPDVRENIVLSLQRLLHQRNHLVHMFKTALENMPTDEHRIVIYADKRPAGEHERRFNAPCIYEVAIIMVGEDFDGRDIVIQKRGGDLQRISETHRSYDALQYPLLFWEGEDGYHFNLKQFDPSTGSYTNKKVSAMEFYAYRLMMRTTSGNHVLKCCQLFHQFIVDMYAKIEAERLLYIRLNQKKLRVEDYIHLRDAVANDVNSTEIGQMVILPATFTGSPRHMHEYAQDAMCYVRNHGRPDLFITFTCNPTWTEVTQELMPGQTPADRHDLTARVFKQKLNKLMDVITKSHIYGETRCWMYSIEWQKRGLPHAHILIWLKEKIRTTQIDDVISAEFPDPENDPFLYDVISKNMIHGPCGPLNPSSSCMRDGKCSKKYPRQALLETQTGDDGYPLYRRRRPEDGGFTAKVRMRIDGQITEVTIDNRWVVPYTPLLSKMFQAHINVEYCNSVKSIKYICKYINKGGDMAVFRIENQNRPIDEISNYQLGRYISSNEAVWRILNFNIHDRYPPVLHLCVHLENGQRVYFTADNAQERAAQPPATTLTAFFQLCQDDAFARTLLYPEVPKFYTWNKATKKFCRRKQGLMVPGQEVRAADAIGRVYTVHPSNAECYYLRLLLHTMRGPTSFSFLKTVNGEQCQTYREACQKLGLLESDEHWDNTLSEASVSSFPAQMRSLFAIIIATCSPSSPKDLWEKYKEALSEDILRQQRTANPSLIIEHSSAIFNQCLRLIEEKCVSISGHTLSELGLELPERDEDIVLNSDILRERCYNVGELERFVEANRPLLVDDQKQVHDAVMDMVMKGTGGVIFLDAPGGTGKTFLINILLAEIRAQGEIAVAIASSGIASTLLEGGRTAHSALNLPLNLRTLESPCCAISRNSGKAEMLKQCKLIIWDECSMAHKKALEALDRTMKDFRGNDRLMGGAALLLAGDFRQTLPVIPRSTPTDELDACLKASHLWRHMRMMTLTTNMRVHVLGDEAARSFAQQLLSLGEGRIPVDCTDTISFPSGFCNMVSSVEELVQKVFPNLQESYQDEQWLCERAILAPTNESVACINIKIQKTIPGATVTYQSIDRGLEEVEAVNYPIEFLNSLEPPGLPPHKLELKVGSPIILLRNLDPPALCNGTRLRVKNLMPHVIAATILTGKARGQDAFIPRVPLIPTDVPFQFKRLQFPIRLAFAMTINKSQGQSLRVVGIDLESPCFSHGQLYVACSRVGTPKHLFIYAPNGRTRNIVYRGALS